MKVKLLLTAFILALAALVFAISAWSHGAAPSSVNSFLSSSEANTPDAARDRLLAAESAARAPDLSQGTWINSDPLKITGLRGRVVLVDFWTFGCYNCRNTLPALKRWDAQYRERGLTVIGVHSPEFDEEKNLENVRREVASLGIRYPVVTDNDYETWRAYGVEAWPTEILLDKQGRIRWVHIGEGRYDETEEAIKKLLAE